MLKLIGLSILMATCFIAGASLNYKQDEADDSIGVCIVHEGDVDYL